MGLRIIMRGNKKEKVKDEDQIAFNQDPMSHYLIKIHQNSVFFFFYLLILPSIQLVNILHFFFILTNLT